MGFIEDEDTRYSQSELQKRRTINRFKHRVKKVLEKQLIYGDDMEAFDAACEEIDKLDSEFKQDLDYWQEVDVNLEWADAWQAASVFIFEDMLNGLDELKELTEHAVAKNCDCKVALMAIQDYFFSMKEYKYALIKKGDLSLAIAPRYTFDSIKPKSDL